MISPFEYVTVLISIVLGLGITQILAGIAKLIQNKKKVVLYWPHLLWVAFILFLQIQEWWVMYELKMFVPWRLPTFLFVMLYPINLYVISKIIFPDKWNYKQIDLRQFYFENFETIFSLMIISAGLSFIYNLVILKLKLTDQWVQVGIIFLFGTLLYKRYSNEFLHKAISVAVTAIACIAIVVEWNEWSIG